MSESFQHFARSRPTGPEQGPAPAAALHVEVIADLICPFCYIGKRRLDEAMRAVQGPSEVSWYPYQLNPDMPPIEGTKRTSRKNTRGPAATTHEDQQQQHKRAGRHNSALPN